MLDVRPHERWVDGRAAFAALVLLIVSIVLAVLAANYDTFPLDATALDRAQGFGEGYDPISGPTNEHNVWIAGVTFALGIALAVWRRLYDVVLLFPLALALWPTGSAMKEIVDRPRPAGDFLILGTVNSASYPSGHVLSSALFAGLWFVLAPELVSRRWVLSARLLAVAWVVLTAKSRIWAGVHWLSDTYGAVLWAAFLTALLIAIRPAFRNAIRIVAGRHGAAVPEHE